MTNEENERLQTQCEELLSLIDHEEDPELTSATFYLKNLPRADVVKMTLICLRDSRLRESHAIRRYWLWFPHNIEFAALTNFVRSLDAQLMKASSTVTYLVNMATALEDPESEWEGIGEATDNVETVIASLGPDQAARALVAVAFEASQSDCEDRLAGAWAAYFDRNSGTPEAQDIFDRAMEKAVALAEVA